MWIKRQRDGYFRTQILCSVALQVQGRLLARGDMDRFLVDCQPAQDRGFAAQEAYANVASQFGTRKLIYEIIRCGIAI